MSCKKCNCQVVKGEHYLLSIGGGVSKVVCEACYMEATEGK